MNEKVVRVASEAGQVGQIPRIRKFIKIDNASDLVTPLLKNKIGTDKTGPPGNYPGFHTDSAFIFFSFINVLHI